MRIGKLRKIIIVPLAIMMMFSLMTTNVAAVTKDNATMNIEWEFGYYGRNEWTNVFSKSGLNVVCKDIDGEYLRPESDKETVTIDSEYTNTNLGNVVSVEGYSFVKSVVVIDKTEYAFDAIAPWKEDNLYQYHYKVSDVTKYKDILYRSNNYAQYYNVICYFTKTKEIGTIDTVDSKSAGIDLKLYDYNANDMNQYSNLKFGTNSAFTEDYNENQNHVTQGIVKNNLIYNNLTHTYEDPILTSWVDENKSLSYLFSDNANEQDANHLFKMKDGYYYYNSEENYAYFNSVGENAGNFTVYDVAAAPSGDADCYMVGNFFPYNKLADNAEIKSEGTVSTPILYNFETGSNATTKNVHFGMTMDTMFIQPKNGEVNGNDMIFEFTGDDDVWVFIDGALVLDIGGIHGAMSGSINFATGEVKVTNVDLTNLRSLMNHAGKDETYINENFEDGSNTFKNYTDHNIKFYYLERGAGASNCKLKFNIQSLPKDSIKVRKEITNINEGSFSDIEFQFKLYLADTDNENINKNDFIEQDGEKYYLYIGNETTDGIFKLKHNQEITFQNIADVNTKYIVQEIGLKQEEYDQVEVEGTVYNNENNNITLDNNGEYLVSTKPLVVGTDISVVFNNKCNANNLHDIDITKQIKDGYSTSDTYQIQVKIGGVLFEGKYKINNGNEQTATNGIITLSANDTVKISNIAAGTSFEVQEIELNPSIYENPTYSYIGDNKNFYVDSVGNDEAISGKVILSKNVHILVENEFKTAKLKIIKTINSLDTINGDAIFTFEIRDQNGNIITKSIRFNDENNLSKETAEIELPVGSYTITELDTLRYEIDADSKKEQQITLNANYINTVTFSNHVVNRKNYSHTDIVVNEFNIDSDNKITISPNKLKANGDS